MVHSGHSSCDSDFCRISGDSELPRQQICRRGSKQKQNQMNSQEQQDTKTKLEAEKDKVDTLVHAMQNHSTTEGNITESPF